MPEVSAQHAPGDEVTLKGTIVGSTEDEKITKVSFHIRDTGIPTVDHVLVNVDSQFLDDVVAPLANLAVAPKDEAPKK